MKRPRRVVYRNNAGCGGGLLVPPEVGRPVAAFAVAKVFAEGFGAPVVAALSISKPASVASPASPTKAAAVSETSAIAVATAPSSASAAPAASVAVSVPVSPATAAAATAP